MPAIPEIGVDELAERLSGAATVIDVRETDEYNAGHVPGATNLPLSTLAERSAEVPTDRPVLVICQKGGRSMRACEHLVQFGCDVTNVAGGTGAWVESGRPVHAGPDTGPS
ncbi:MAG: rhodanese-like domain-containing protein [Microthrixaceae bacterium]